MSLNGITFGNRNAVGFGSGKTKVLETATETGQKAVETGIQVSAAKLRELAKNRMGVHLSCKDTFELQSL